jgi:putative membrane protein
MTDFLIDYYLWVKAVHIMAVISWMAGLFYLPRLFVYHSQVEVGSNEDQRFQTMEQKLLRIIMNPAMIIAWVFGLMLMMTSGIIEGSYWFHVKFLAVIFMTGFHMACAKWRRKFSEGNNEKAENFFRKANEVPTVLMFIIVIMAVVKPF